MNILIGSFLFIFVCIFYVLAIYKKSMLLKINFNNWKLVDYRVGDIINFNEYRGILKAFDNKFIYIELFRNGKFHEIEYKKLSRYEFDYVLRNQSKIERESILNQDRIRAQIEKLNK